MEYFIRHQLTKDQNGYVLTLYVNPVFTEFSNEFEKLTQDSKGGILEEKVRRYITEKLPDVKVNAVKVMAGSILLTTLFFTHQTPNVNAVSNTVSQALQAAEERANVIINGKVYQFSTPAVIKSGTTYVPVRELVEALGGEVWWNGESQTVGINRGNVKIAFTLGSTKARVNGQLVTMQPSYLYSNKTMVPLRFISEALGFHVHWDGGTQTVNITSTKQPSGEQLSNEVTYTSYTVQSGDNMWNLSIQFGVPMTELLQVNNMTENSGLSVGQKIIVPVHHIAVKERASEKHGEYLDWWTEAQYVFPIGKIATVRDFQTGRAFQVKRTIGANHADCEPLTANDAAIMKEVWGGSYSWKERAVIVEVDGRKIAASMASMPHDIQYITNNNFDGHFDIHFRNSTRHSDGKISESHQKQVRIAAGIE